MSTGRIVVGVDGSPSSIDALRWAKAQADATGAELEAVMAWAYPTASYPTLAGYVPLGDAVDIEAETRTSLEQTVKEALGDTSVRQRVFEGHAATALVEASKHAGLLVVGSRGHGTFVSSLVGSVSQYVIAHASCPVVVIRHPREPHTVS